MNPILEAKKKYKFLYLLKFNDEQLLIFRTLTYKEYKYYIDLITVLPNLLEDLKDDLFKECVVEYGSPIVMYKMGDLTDSDKTQGYVPIDYAMQTIEAGIVDTLFNTVMILSGANDPQKFIGDIADVRMFSENAIDQRTLSMVSSLFKCLPETLENMHWIDLAQLIAQSELLLAGQVPEVPLSLSKQTTEPKVNFEEQNKRYDTEY